MLLLNTLMYTKTLSHTNSNYVIVFNVHVQEIVPYTEILDSSWSFATTPLYVMGDTLHWFVFSVAETITITYLHVWNKLNYRLLVI